MLVKHSHSSSCYMSRNKKVQRLWNGFWSNVGEGDRGSKGELSMTCIPSCFPKHFMRQNFEGLLWPSLWVEVDSGWSKCNLRVRRSISPSFCVSFFFLKQLLLLPGHVVTAPLSSLKEWKFIISLFLPFFLLHAHFGKLEAASSALSSFTDLTQSFCGAGHTAYCQMKLGCS